ncbi:hypothetical protein ACFXG4_31860 [Nocardia sp. NPDC059246]|uniref:hypothetical protein n=1 Tax=unclassified Nocardia TaxID=2637762 RepID=UPI00368C1175
MLASFNAATMGIHFDGRYLGPGNHSTSADPRTLFSEWVGGNVPHGIMAHEIAHLYHTATTSVGLKTFFSSFLSEYLSRRVLTEAADIGLSVPEGGIRRSGQMNPANPKLWHAYSDSHNFNAALALIAGGVEFEQGVPDLSQFSDTPFRDLMFYSREDWPAERCGVLGTKHLFEGFATAVELMCSPPVTGVSDLPPADPYLVCIRSYNKSCQSRGSSGSLLQFAAIIDTALMMDAWTWSNEEPNILPFPNFIKLVDIVTEDPQLLRSPVFDREFEGSAEDGVREFQDSLLESAGFSIPSVRRITENMIARVPHLNTEIKLYAMLPGSIVDEFTDLILLLLKIRLELYGGGCPLGGYANKEFLVNILSRLPTVTSGFPVVGDFKKSEQADAKMLMTFGSGFHKIAIDELVYGRRQCPSRESCHLTYRPACDGVTMMLRPELEQCAREVAVDYVLSLR